MPDYRPVFSCGPRGGTPLRSNMSITRYRRLLSRLAKLGLAGWGDLLSAQTALIAAQLLVWFRPTARLVSAAPFHKCDAKEAVGDDQTLWPKAQSTALAVRRMADHGLFRPKCLVRSVALSRMLNRRGIQGSRVRVGVRLCDGQFAAHAWVELGEKVLGDDERHTNSFAHLVDLQLPQ